jgi:hypothetical protein
MIQYLAAKAAQSRIATLCSLGGNYDPRQAALRIVESTLKASGATGPPFDPRRYCEFHNVEVRDQWLVDCDARLLPTKNGYIAEIHADAPKPRKNFSMCHELGHTFFFRRDSEFRHQDVLCNGDLTGVREERLCDFIAAELLMPRDCFRSVAADLTVGFGSIQALASLFGVSLQSGMLRVVELDVWKCYFVNFLVKPNEDFSVQSWGFSKSWREQGGVTVPFRAIGKLLGKADGSVRSFGVQVAGGTVHVDFYKYHTKQHRRACAFVYYES